MLTAKEIDFWDRLIEESGDLDLARKFYPKAGRPQRVKEVFRNAVRDLAHYDCLLQEKLEQGVYRPELTDDEVRQIAADSLREDVKNGALGEIFRKLDFPVYGAADISERELGSLVDKVLRDGAQGYSPGKDPRAFAKGLVEFPVRHECPEEVDFTYAVFDDSRYQRFAKPRLAKNIVALKVFHGLILGRFEEASKIISKHGQFYDRGLAQRLVGDFIDHEEFTEENYPLEYLVAAQRSALGSLFPNDMDRRVRQKGRAFDKYVRKHKADIPKEVDISQAREDHLAGYKRLALAMDIADYLDDRRVVAPTDEMDKAVFSFRDGYTKLRYAQKRCLHYEKMTAQVDEHELNKAFDKAEEMFGILAGMRDLKDLLCNDQFVARVGKENIKEILSKRARKAIQAGKAYVVHALRFGAEINQGRAHPAVPHFEEYVEVDRSALLESMISAVAWTPGYLLSGKYDFSSDNLTFAGTGEIDDAYRLYQAIQQEGGRLPSDCAMKKLVFLKMATQVKDYYEGGGMRTMIGVFDDPANSGYIDRNQARRLLSKVVTEYFERSRIDGIMGAEVVSHFYAMASSSLGALVKDDEKLEPYFKLCQFIRSR